MFCVNVHMKLSSFLKTFSRDNVTKPSEFKEKMNTYIMIHVIYPIHNYRFSKF